MITKFIIFKINYYKIYFISHLFIIITKKLNYKKTLYIRLNNFYKYFSNNYINNFT
jgi:hypothetical protein